MRELRDLSRLRVRGYMAGNELGQRARGAAYSGGRSDRDDYVLSLSP